MPINGSAERAERDGLSLSGLITDADKLAERAEKIASSFEALRRDLTGNAFPVGEKADGPGRGGHLGALVARLDRISNALRDLEVCREEFAACVGPTPNPNVPGQQDLQTVKYVGIENPHLYPETR